MIMNLKTMHFSDLAEYHEFLGQEAPEHPLFSVICMSSNTVQDVESCVDQQIALSSDFYSISLKHIISGEIFYGRTKYDCQNGTMIFTAPGQSIRVTGLKVESTGRTIAFHEDFIRGHAIKNELKKYHYFSYAVNEALHLSPKEEKMVSGLFNQIEMEYQNNHDAFSKDLILSLLDTLLKYANRFYHRQFLHRQETKSDLLDKFVNQVEVLISKEGKLDKRVPTIEEVASNLNMTSRYLSDALKVETGKTAIENLHLHMIDKAKDLLLDSNATVATIAYDLGFEYPQYFARLFKKKVGLTPTEYRKQMH